MKDQLKALQGRRRWFLGGLGAVAAGAALASASSNAAQSAAPAATGFVPAKHAGDDWMEMPGTHRAFLDTSTTNGGITVLNYAHNMLLVHVEDYAGKESDYAMIICYRHQATPLAYNEAMWAKYGDGLSAFLGLKDTNTEQPYLVNPMNIPNRADFASRGHTLNEMTSRGVHYAVCNRATLNVSGFLARRIDGVVADIHRELVANLIPNARIVPAGVTAVMRAQERGYSLLYAG